jgi:regulator of sigma E protease
MNILIGVIVGLLVLMILVTLHEFGHFIMARKNGVNVLEFGIGFPPRAIAWIKDPKTGKWKRLPRKEWSKDSASKVVFTDGKDKKMAQKGMIFSLNWLPIGGFCQMDGESAADKRKGTFGASSFWSKTKILFAGVAMNWLAAIVILTILAWTGMPDFLDNQFTIAEDTRISWIPVTITSVVDDSPAADAGMLENDHILSIDGNLVKYASDVTTYDNEHAGQEVTFEIIRGDIKSCGEIKKCDGKACVECDGENEIKYITVELNEAGSDFLLGVSMESSKTTSYSTWSAPFVGIGLTAQMTGQTFQGVGQMVWNFIHGIGSLLSFDDNARQVGQAEIEAVGDSVSGPVGIIGILFPTFTSAGPANLAFLAAIISISLACMNVLPIPALDGGRWLLIAIYKLRKKELTKETEEKMVTRAFIVLLALMFIVTILDITRFF